MPDPMPPPPIGRTRRPPYEPPRYRPRRSRWLLVGVPMLAVFAAFASIVWLAYVDGAPGSAMGEPPLIKADASPLKLAPDDPGGRVVADQGEVRELFRDQPAPQPELLLPPPEEPITALTEVQPASPEEPVPAQAPPATVEESALAGAEPSPPVSDGVNRADTAPGRPQQAPADQARAAAGQGGPSDASADAEVPAEDPGAALEALLAEVAATAQAQQDSSNGTPARPADAGATPAPAEREPPSQQATDVRPAIAAPAPERGESTGTRPARAEREPEIAAIAPGEPVGQPQDARPQVTRPASSEAGQQTARLEPRRIPVQPAPSQDGAAGGSYRIQLAAVREETDARRAWDLFQLDLGDVLRGTDPIIERADTANGVFYRVQIGPFANLAAAESLCDELKQRNASCFVIRR